MESIVLRKTKVAAVTGFVCALLYFCLYYDLEDLIIYTIITFFACFLISASFGTASSIYIDWISHDMENKIFKRALKIALYGTFGYMADAMLSFDSEFTMIYLTVFFSYIYFLTDIIVSKFRGKKICQNDNKMLKIVMSCIVIAVFLVCLGLQSPLNTIQKLL
ncbi:hypothetical protein [Thermoactinomyces sp. DSM 45892]|uniref:hypothetical protein n=1 Tax=Thermoactinomyces sp. DSM 45892 TaxID=1882753 RepID=UPI00089B31E2|nr:hypothetical protein [Thermoactinomyces sp. DSM 45892]SDY56979.1 hypothetical protein SAMN05444416_1064 [Thermoactinomyces sp. DSM 45892]